MFRPRLIKLTISLFFLSFPALHAQGTGFQDTLSQNGFQYVQITPTRGKIVLDGEWRASTDNAKTWNNVDIPGTFSGGTVIFEKRVFIPSELVSKNIFTLTIGTGGTSTEIRVNNEYVAIHNGAYSQFEVKIPDRLLQAGGENIIQVISNNELNPVSTIPLKQLAFQPKCYGGPIQRYLSRNKTAYLHGCAYRQNLAQLG